MSFKAITPLVLLVVALTLLGPASGAVAHRDQICPEAQRAAHGGDRFDAHRLVGKRIQRARRIARRHDCTVRVVKRDGEALDGTADYRNNRINVVVKDRRVKRIRGVF